MNAGIKVLSECTPVSVFPNIHYMAKNGRQICYLHHARKSKTIQQEKYTRKAHDHALTDFCLSATHHSSVFLRPSSMPTCGSYPSTFRAFSML